MKHVIVDASTALAWCFPDEWTAESEGFLAAMGPYEILVPAVWALELTNAIAVAVSQKRIRAPAIEGFQTLLGQLTIIEDARTVQETISAVLALACEYNLTAYDAAYLELALRYKAPLATLDSKLRKAATKAGARLFTAQP